MLAEANMDPQPSFRPKGEEIDGSFFYDGRAFLLEAKWTQDPLPASAIYQFRGKVEGKLIGTVGAFISMGGFSKDAIDALVAGKTVNTILFDGDDIRAIAANQFDIASALKIKIRAAATVGTSFRALRDAVTHRPIRAEARRSKPSRQKTVIVEGRNDALLIHALLDALGPSSYRIEVIPAGGALNLAATANLAYANNERDIIIIADGEGNDESVRDLISAEVGRFSSAEDGEPRIYVFNPSFARRLGIFEAEDSGQQLTLFWNKDYLSKRFSTTKVLRTVPLDDGMVMRLLADLGVA
jgi:5S rRNA maturation endonuclease (ribonuclease M5)